MISHPSMQIPDKQPASNHAVIVLASGLSQRLGQPKQLLYKDGEPLIRHMTKLALMTQPQAIIVVMPDNHPLIIKALAPLADEHAKIHTVINPIPQTGMAHSLRLGVEAVAALRAPEAERVLIMGIDQILLDKLHLSQLLAGQSAVVASGYPSWQHLNKKHLDEKYLDKRHLNDTSTANTSIKNIVGLPLVIDRALLKQWQSALAGDKGLRHLIRALPPSQIHTVSRAQLSYDIDTPEQLVHAREQGWLDKPSD